MSPFALYFKRDSFSLHTKQEHNTRIEPEATMTWLESDLRHALSGWIVRLIYISYFALPNFLCENKSIIYGQIYFSNLNWHHCHDMIKFRVEWKMSARFLFNYWTVNQFYTFVKVTRTISSIPFLTSCLWLLWNVKKIKYATTSHACKKTEAITRILQVCNKKYMDEFVRKGVRLIW